MKKLMLIGGFWGFLLCLVCGLCIEGTEWPGILFRSALGCLGGGMLMRWWGEAWVKNLKTVHAQQRQALAKAQANSEPKTPWKVTSHAKH
jgi:hypothetical protein